LISKSPGDPHDYKEVDFDVISYNPVIEVLAPSNKEIVGINNIQLEWNEGKVGNEFFFHCIDLTIDSVIINGAKTEFEFTSSTDTSDSYYKVKSLDDNDNAFLKIYYHGKMSSEGGNFNWGGVHYSSKKLYAMGVGFFNPSVGATRHWLPCYDLPSDKAKFEINISTMDTLFAISNGKYLGQVPPFDGITAYKWSLEETEVATYLMTFAIGDYAKVEIPTNDVPVTAYMYNTEESIEAGEFAFRLVPEMITAFKEFFDYDYPFETMGYYAASKGAMEHQTMVTMSHNQILSVSNSMDSMYSTAAHELAHQWFGNLVTPYDFRDAWLNEGFATFFEYVWIKSKLGDSEYREEIMRLRNRYINSTAVPEQHIPLYNFSRFSKNNYPSTIYQKGGLILALIMDIVGEEVFKTKINEYLSLYEHNNVTTEILKDIFSDELEDKFWNTWVYGRGFPEIDIKVSSDEVNTYIVAEQREHEFQIFDLDLNYSISFGAETNPYTHSIENKIDTLTIPKNEMVTNFEVVDNLYLYEIMSTDIITSVENSTLLEVKLKSNIVSNQLSVVYTSDSKYLKEYSIEIVTLAGQTMFIDKGYFLGEINYDLSDFATGIYFVYISEGENKIVEKILVK
jgi:aminopeptidase N